MRKLTLTALLLGGFLLGRTQVASAQKLPTAYWLEVNNGELLLKTPTDSRPVSKSLSLPNGTYLDYQKKVATLADGTRVELHEGDAVSLNGDITLAKRPNVPAPVAQEPAAPPAPVAPPAPAAPPITAFAYEAPAPVNGKLKGVVELGASGFNSFIVKMDGRRNWHLEKAEFGVSLIMENMTDENEVKQVLKSYIAKMLDYGVGGTDIHFMVSSGALKAEVTPRIVRALRTLGYVVNTVTPEREGALSLRALLPTDFAEKAFVVDMGSANTKISWLENGQLMTREVIGAKYYEKGMSDEAAAEAVQAAVQQVPMTLRQTCFIMGGSPYEMAKKTRQGQARYTVLAPPADYHFETAKGKAGTVIYKALADATGCQQFVFDAESNFTIGYLLTLQQLAAN